MLLEDYRKVLMCKSTLVMLPLLRLLSMRIKSFLCLLGALVLLLQSRGALSLLVCVSELVQAQPREGQALPPPTVAVDLFLARGPGGFHLLFLLLLHLMHGLFGHLLSGHPLDDILLPRLPVPDPDEQARGRVDRDGTAQDDCCQRERAIFGSDAICTGS